MELYPELCFNLSYFKELLKGLRKTDDNIIIKLNKTNNSPRPSCVELFEAISKSYAERDELINYCTEHFDSTLVTLRNQVNENQTDSNIKSHLYAEEAKLRAIRNEDMIESIIRERSYNVIRDRCRILQLPNTYSDFQAKSKKNTDNIPSK